MPERVTLVGRFARLEPIELSDAADLVAAVTEDQRSYGYTLVPSTLDDMCRYVESALEDEQTGWALPFTVRLSSGRVVGSTRFLDLGYWSTPSQSWPPGRPGTGGAGRPNVAEIGSTWLAASAQRTGTNTEAKLLMLGHAFDVWAVERVTFKTDRRNARSRRAIERIGARFEGVRRAHLPATDGTVRDSAYYSIIRDEWPDVRTTLADRLGRR